MDRYSYRREREHSNSNPSFSSTLLDAIYRSIDEGGEEELVLYRETMRKKQSNSTLMNTKVTKASFQSEEDMANFQRACMIEKWMEKKVSEKVVVRRKSAADFERKSRNDPLFLNSSSSSSDSSSGGGFSSSEAESVYAVNSSRSASCYGLHRPKPIRTSVSVQPEKFTKRPGKDLNLYGEFYDDCNHQRRDYVAEQKAKHEGSGFVKTKSKALKIYGDLKKVKQPISPGGRLASFLNSLFSPGNAKKAKRAYNDNRGDSERKIKSTNTSTCSSASSFSRSCLSKTPSSTGKSINGMKRSVRFYPVSVIVDEDCQPCGHKSLYEDQETIKTIRKSINEELNFHVTEKNRRVEEAARELLRNYQKKVECEFDLRNAHIKNIEVFDDEEDDAASCASSDLFELDNLSSIGMDRYREELPVYETTRLDTNRAIANGLIL